MHENSMLLFRQYVDPLIKPESCILEVGPDKTPISSYQADVLKDQTDTPLFKQWSTLDLQNRAQVSHWMLSDNVMPSSLHDKYDIVFAAQVIEHVRKPWLWLPEIARACKPGGKLIVICPTSWPFHEAPYDCYRIYPEAMKALGEEIRGVSLELARCVSLEPIPVDVQWENIIPGVARDWQGDNQRYSRVSGSGAVVDTCVMRAFDTIAIWTKLDE